MDHKVKICFITAFEPYYDEFRRIFPKLNAECFVLIPITVDDLANVIKNCLKANEEKYYFILNKICNYGSGGLVQF